MNFAYTLTAPWAPPDPTPTPTPMSRPTPTPQPGPGADGALLNPNFDHRGTDWAISGAASFLNGAARLTPTSNYAPARIIQWVRLTPGATYRVSTEIASSASARVTLGVKWGQGNEGAAQPVANSQRVTTRAMQFTVPEGVTQVGVYCQAAGSTAADSWATADDFRLVRVN